MKDPAFLFYSQDFVTGTQFLTDEQVGKYIRLLCAQHNHGRLTEKQVAIICKGTDPEIMSKFKRDENGCFYNERLENEVIRRQEYCESRRKSRNTHVERTSNIRETHVERMETETENKALNVTIEKGVQGEKIKYADYVTMTEKEHTKLIEELGDEMTAMCIEKLNAYKGSKGKKYKSDYLAIRNWVANQVIIDKNNRNGITRKSGKQPATSAADIDFITAAMYRDQPVQ